MTTGELIKQARKQRNMSQKELAEKLGVSASMIGQYENDLRNPKLETIQRIANALEVDPYSLMDFDTATAVLEERINNKSKDLLTAFDQLNEKGQSVAVERVEELGKVPEYKK